MSDSYFADRAGPHSGQDSVEAEGYQYHSSGNGKSLGKGSAKPTSMVPSPSGLQTQEDAQLVLHEHLAKHPDIRTPKPLSHPHLLAWHLFNIPMTVVIFFLLAIFILDAYPQFHRYDKTLPDPTRIVGWISISVGSGVALFLYVLRTPLYYIIEALYEGSAADDGILPGTEDFDQERAETLSKRAALTTWIANGVLEEVFRLLAIGFLYFVSQELMSQPVGHKWPNVLENTFWLGFGWNVAESLINLGQNVVNVLATRQSDLRKTLPSRLNRNFAKMFEEQDEREALLAQSAQANSSAFSFARDERGRWGVVAVESGPSQGSSAQASHRPSDLEPVQEQDLLKKRALAGSGGESEVSERSSLLGTSSPDVGDNQSNITVRASRIGGRQLDDPLRLGRPSSLRPRFLRGTSSPGIGRVELGNVSGDLSGGAIALSAPTALDLELADILGAPLPYIFPPIYLLTRLGAALLDIGFAMLLGQAWQVPSDPTSPRVQTSGLGAVLLTLFIVVIIRSTLNVIYGAALPKIGLTGAGCISIILGLVSVLGGFTAWGEVF